MSNEIKAPDLLIEGSGAAGWLELSRVSRGQHTPEIVVSAEVPAIATFVLETA